MLSDSISFRSRQLSDRVCAESAIGSWRRVPNRWSSGASWPSRGSGEVRDRYVEWVPLLLERRVVVAMGAPMGAPGGFRGSVAARPRSRG
jgi:hypothetical protein